MTFGMDLLTVHVVLSLVGILSGFAVARSMVAGEATNTWTSLFLLTTAATSITGFVFPFTRLLPSHVVGIVSLIALVPAIYAYYAAPPSQRWNSIFAGTSMTALYLNVFVLVVQLFQKVPALKALAPTQTEAPFLIAQIVLLVAFLWLGISAVKGYRAQSIVTV